jgi:hypothetical protein
MDANGGKIDQRLIPYYKANGLYEVAADQIKSGIITAQKDVVPKAPVTNVYVGNQPAINDIDAKIDHAIDYEANGNTRQHHNENAPSVPFNELTPDVQEVVYNIVKNAGVTKRVNGKDVPLTHADIYIKRENGVKYIMQRTGSHEQDKLIAPMDFTSINLANHSGNTSAKQKQEVLKHENAPAATHTPETKKETLAEKMRRLAAQK